MTKNHRWALYKKSPTARFEILVGCFESETDYAADVETRKNAEWKAASKRHRADKFVVRVGNNPRYFIWPD